MLIEFDVDEEKALRDAQRAASRSTRAKKSEDRQHQEEPQRSPSRTKGSTASQSGPPVTRTVPRAPRPQGGTLLPPPPPPPAHHGVRKVAKNAAVTEASSSQQRHSEARATQHMLMSQSAPRDTEDLLDFLEVSLYDELFLQHSTPSNV